ncbi:MAG: SDR family NAD(P)-dependent oxidoreductase, partial [Stackebrandtia sp.]
MSESNQPPQTQKPPGRSGSMDPHPRDAMRDYHGNDLLSDKRALITGGDSGIGRAVAVASAKEGADVAVSYLDEHDDAERTADLVGEQHRRCPLLPGDLADAAHCRQVVTDTVEA